MRVRKNRRRKNLEGTRRSLRMQKGKIHVPNVGVGDTWRDAQFSFHIKVFTSPSFSVTRSPLRAERRLPNHTGLKKCRVRLWRLRFWEFALRGVFWYKVWYERGLE